MVLVSRGKVWTKARNSAWIRSPVRRARSICGWVIDADLPWPLPRASSPLKCDSCMVCEWGLAMGSFWDYSHCIIFGRIIQIILRFFCVPSNNANYHGIANKKILIYSAFLAVCSSFNQESIDILKKISNNLKLILICP